MEKLCPLNALNQETELCTEGECAWYMPHIGRCAIPELNMRLLDLTAAIEALKPKSREVPYDPL